LEERRRALRVAGKELADQARVKLGSDVADLFTEPDSTAT
jgi:hypothetical protein